MKRMECRYLVREIQIMEQQLAVKLVTKMTHARTSKRSRSLKAKSSASDRSSS